MSTTLDHDQAVRQARDELVTDHAARSRAVDEAITAAAQARMAAHHRARVAAESQDSHGAQVHRREEGVQANRIRELEAEQRQLLLERDRIVSGNDPRLASLTLKARQHAAMTAQSRHSDAKQAFEALLSDELLGAAREYVASCFDVQQTPSPAAAALAAGH